MHFHMFHTIRVLSMSFELFAYGLPSNFLSEVCDTQNSANAIFVAYLPPVALRGSSTYISYLGFQRNLLVCSCF